MNSTNGTIQMDKDDGEEEVTSNIKIKMNPANATIESQYDDDGEEEVTSIRK